MALENLNETFVLIMLCVGIAYIIFTTARILERFYFFVNRNERHFYFNFLLKTIIYFLYMLSVFVIYIELIATRSGDLAPMSSFSDEWDLNQKFKLFKEKSYKAYYDKGYTDGKKDGYNAGHRTGYKNGLADGISKLFSQEELHTLNKLLSKVTALSRVIAVNQKQSLEITDDKKESE